MRSPSLFQCTQNTRTHSLGFKFRRNNIQWQKEKKKTSYVWTHGHTAYQCHRSFAIGLYLFPALLPFFVTHYTLHKIYININTKTYKEFIFGENLSCAQYGVYVTYNTAHTARDQRAWQNRIWVSLYVILHVFLLLSFPLERFDVMMMV